MLYKSIVPSISYLLGVEFLFYFLFSFKKAVSNNRTIACDRSFWCGFPPNRNMKARDPLQRAKCPLIFWLIIILTLISFRVWMTVKKRQTKSWMMNMKRIISTKFPHPIQPAGIWISEEVWGKLPFTYCISWTHLSILKLPGFCLKSFQISVLIHMKEMNITVSSHSFILITILINTY